MLNKIIENITNSLTQPIINVELLQKQNQELKNKVSVLELKNNEYYNDSKTFLQYYKKEINQNNTLKNLLAISVSINFALIITFGLIWVTKC